MDNIIKKSGGESRKDHKFYQKAIWALMKTSISFGREESLMI